MPNGNNIQTPTANDTGSTPILKDHALNLYNKLISDGYELGSQQNFLGKMEDSATRKRFYDKILSDGYNLGSYDNFNKKIGIPFETPEGKKNKPTPTQAPAKQESDRDAGGSYISTFNTVLNAQLEGLSPNMPQSFQDEYRQRAAQSTAWMFNTASAQQASDMMDGFSSTVDEKINNIYRGKMGIINAPELSDDENMKLQQYTNEKKYLKQAKNWLIASKTASGDPENAINDGIDYLKLTDPATYKSYQPFLKDGRAIISDINRQKKPEKSQGVGNFNPVPGEIMGKTNSLPPDLQMQAEATGLNNNITKIASQLDNSFPGWRSLDEKSPDYDPAEVEKFRKQYGNNPEALNRFNSFIKLLNDNTAAYRSLPSKYPEAIKRQHDIENWQKRYDNWSKTGKFLYSLWQGAYSGTKEIGRGIESTFTAGGDILSGKSGVELKQEHAAIAENRRQEDISDFAKGLEVPEIGGYERDVKGNVITNSFGEPVIKSGVYKTVESLAGFVPTILTFAVSDGLMSGAMKAGEETAASIDEITGMSMEAPIKSLVKTKLMEHAPMFATVGITGFGDAYDSAIDNGKTPAEATAYATASTALDGLIFSMNPPQDMFDPIIRKNAMYSSDIFKEAENRGVMELLHNPDSYHFGLRVLADAGAETSRKALLGSMQGAYMALGEHLKHSVLDAGQPDPDFMQSLKDNITMFGIMSALGGAVGSVRGMRSAAANLKTDAIWDAANNYQSINALLTKKDLSREIGHDQAMMAKLNLNVIKQLHDKIPVTDIHGNSISEDTRKIMLSNDYQKHQYEQQLNENLPEPVKDMITKRIKLLDSFNAVLMGADPGQTVYTVNNHAVDKATAEKEIENGNGADVVIHGEEAPTLAQQAVNKNNIRIIDNNIEAAKYRLSAENERQSRLMESPGSDDLKDIQEKQQYWKDRIEDLTADKKLVSRYGADYDYIRRELEKQGKLTVDCA